jgi:hypothetical protein
MAAICCGYAVLKARRVAMAIVVRQVDLAALALAAIVLRRF